MAFSIEITRPDDLLRLRVTARNLRIDPQRANAAGDGIGDEPALVVDVANQPAFLTVDFAPQSIAEGAYYEATPVSVTPDAPAGDSRQAPPVTIETPAGPGSTPVRMSHGSRLVFRVPAGTRIPLTVAGLLDWSPLELSVNGIARIGPQPTAADIAGAPAIAKPADTETALELPYKLVVSPTADVAWAHRVVPFTSRGRTELWHTRLQRRGADGPEELTPEQPASLRAIWSDDFNTVDGLTPGNEDRDLGRSALSPNDHHQLVVKTSAFRGYEGEFTLNLAGGLGGAGGGAVLLSSPLSAPGFALSLWRTYVPQPFYADRLMLSSLGGWLHSRGTWPVVRKARPRFPLGALDLNDVVTRVDRLRAGDLANGLRVSPVLAPAGLEVLQPTPAPAETAALDLVEWVHSASQGRDHYVKVVYDGILLPFCNRASLVKITERKFKTVNGLVVAHLYQRYFIVVREPVKTFAADDHGMLLKRIEITTTQTPDIAPPQYVVPGSRSFWVEVMRSANPADHTRLMFAVKGTGSDGSPVDLKLPMLFVSSAAVGTVRDAVYAAYSRSDSIATMAARDAVVPGQKVLFAPRDAGASNDNTQLVTRTLNFVMHAGQPRLLRADVNVPQVQELLGTDAPTTIRLYPGYVSGGLDAGSGVFAEVVRNTPTAGDPFAAVTPTTLGVNFTSDQAGGFATPNLGVSTLSRQHGPLAGTVADAVADRFDPASFFQAGLAKLFGTFDLASLLDAGSLGAAAPKLQTHADDIPGGKLLVATLDWTPAVHDRDLGIAAFKKNDDTALVVHGRIEKPSTFDAAGAPVVGDTKSDFNGRLNHFSVSVLDAVTVNFSEFAFAARSGAKPDVTVRLDSERPLEFKGDLVFVEELRKAIPPDLFGDGPSLDLQPSGIRAGFSFALPPVAVGVFALRDISLGAALTLPFLDGRPTLDFNVSERAHPFLLSIGIFGGGGFFGLQLDTAGLRRVEASFEFGATASIDIGVASGGVHIMAGIYFSLERKESRPDLAPTLTGYLRMGGELSVLGLVRLSLEFTLSFTYDGGRDKAYGRATLTVQIEIVFFSVSVELTVEKAFGGSSGDPTFRQLFAAEDVWTDYAEAFA